MTSSTSTATPMRHSFAQQAENVKAPKSDINALILDYLTVAGYPNAAARFCSEANLSPQQPNSDITIRQRIQRAIHEGEIEAAIEFLNELDPAILDENGPLHFALLRLQMVELIRKCTASPGGDITPALDFATAMLGPRAAQDEQFLEDLEKTMTLLVFPHDSLDPSIAALLQPKLRREVADQVNATVLDRQYRRKDVAIRKLLQIRAWSEGTVRHETKNDLPSHIELGLDGDGDGDGEDKQNGQDEPMLTT